MSDYDYGPLQSYEVTWTNGHVERVRCHQVSYSGTPSLFSSLATKTQDQWIQMHGMIDSRRRLVLAVREESISSIRLVTDGEEFAGESFSFGGSAASEEADQ